MNTRYSFPSDSLCNSSTTVPYSSSPPATEDRMARNRPAARAGAPSFLIRTAMRISRARWFNFLRRVFHYQNGSRSDLGSNPFNSSTWMTLELLALLVQISIITFTLSISKKESPIWPMRIWIVGYDIGCLLSLLLLYGRYRQLYVSQVDGFSLPDVEQQRSSEDSRFSHLMNKCRTSLELFFAICYSFPFLLFLLLCCCVPLISSVLGYNMNMGAADKGASDDQISRLPSWRYKRVDSNLEAGNSAPANEDPDPVLLSPL
ncbi:RING-type domain-containing protein [Citrus sinensis]|uniref:RING-type domain-containing protein n=1 Tax=Citrus sinensis TaxID=2711 RepID=A0ACB8P1H7_CITSI|nr:RING-type domain-containing protein [Citrus sinensis]